VAGGDAEGSAVRDLDPDGGLVIPVLHEHPTGSDLSLVVRSTGHHHAPSRHLG
jgi:hypothetical protein